MQFSQDLGLFPRIFILESHILEMTGGFGVDKGFIRVVVMWALWKALGIKFEHFADWFELGSLKQDKRSCGVGFDFACL